MKDEIKLVIAMLIFGSIGIFVKNIALSSSLIVLWRTYIGVIFIGLILYFKKMPINFNMIIQNRIPLIIAGTVLGGGWAFLFETYRYTSVSMATLLYYSAPIMVFFLSTILFKEKITFYKLVGIIAALMGMIIINFIGVEKGSTLGIIYGFISALLYASLMIMNKFIKNLSGLESTFIQLFIAAIVMSIYVFATNGSHFPLPQGEDIILILIVGIVHTGIACYLYFSSMQNLNGQTISIMSYIDPCSALIFSFLFLNERLSFWQVLGGFLILGGIAFKEYKEREKKQS